MVTRLNVCFRRWQAVAEKNDARDSNGLFEHRRIHPRSPRFQRNLIQVVSQPYGLHPRWLIRLLMVCQCLRLIAKMMHRPN
jgi:hypothetical protein